MNQSAPGRDVIELGVRLVDAAHMAWLAAQVECVIALRSWFQAGAGQRGDANLVYRAALDREEAAARDLERLSALAAGIV